MGVVINFSHLLRTGMLPWREKPVFQARTVTWYQFFSTSACRAVHVNHYWVLLHFPKCITTYKSCNLRQQCTFLLLPKSCLLEQSIKCLLSNHNNICFCVHRCAFSILISNYTIYGMRIAWVKDRHVIWGTYGVWIVHACICVCPLLMSRCLCWWEELWERG